MSAEQRLAERQRKTKPLLKSLESWLREKMKTLSRHSELAKAFAYALNQWPALTYYANDGWVEIDNNIAENALRAVSLGRKNFLFFGSDHGGERGALLYSLIGTCKLNDVDPESYLRHVLGVIADAQTDAAGRTTEYSPDVVTGLITRITTPDGRASAFYYNHHSQLTSATGITSAPSAISLRACAMAASGARYRPPSEKLSEVMLTMPKMMSDLFMGASIIIIIEHESHTDARVERESPGE